MSGPAPNARARRIEESPTLAIIGRAARLRAEGKDVIALGAGEPDFPTPEPIAQAGIAAIQQGRTRYTAAAGTAELRQAGADWFRATYGLPFTADEVLVTAGAKPALHMALSTVVEKGDRVLVLAPYWVSYPALVTMADGEPVVLPPVPEDGFVHRAEAIDAAAARTGARGILLNFPNNPSGACASRAQIEAIVQVCRARDLWILSDEIYGLLRYDDQGHTSPAAVPGGRERTMVVNGFTKSHTMTGWRIGFLAGPKPVIAAAARIQSQVLGNACTISQEAALHGCRHPLPDEVARRVQAFDERRRYLVEECNRIDGLRLLPPQGAFYALVDVRQWCERLRCDDVGLAERLLEQQLVAGVPGAAFGIPGFLRFSYAASLDELRRAVERLRAFGKAIR
jgi:aspartate aminotransferase